MVMAFSSGWRCVVVPPPNPLAAIGGALRHAFPMTGPMRSCADFAPLLRRLETQQAADRA